MPAHDLLAQVPDIPEELDCIDTDLLDDLRSGRIDKIPESAADCVPPELRDRIPDELLDLASQNTALTAVLIAVGIIAVGGFLFSVARSAFKSALFFAAAAAAALIWFLLLD